MSTEGNSGTEWEMEGGEDTTMWQQKTGWEFQLSVKKGWSPKLGHKLHIVVVWMWVPSQENSSIDQVNIVIATPKSLFFFDRHSTTTWPNMTLTWLLHKFVFTEDDEPHKDQDQDHMMMSMSPTMATNGTSTQQWYPASKDDKWKWTGPQPLGWLAPAPSLVSHCLQGGSQVLSTSGNGAHPFWGSFILFCLCIFSMYYIMPVIYMYYMYKTLTQCTDVHNLQVLNAITWYFNIMYLVNTVTFSGTWADSLCHTVQ